MNLRPLRIYGLGWDKNITEIVRFFRGFCLFPLFGKVGGFHQLILAEDVAGACVVALETLAAANRAYNLSAGSDRLS